MEQRIKTIRKSNNLTQTEFGKRIGVKGNTVTNYETGLRIPSEAVILAICREFDVSERGREARRVSGRCPQPRPGGFPAALSGDTVPPEAGGVVCTGAND